MKWMTLAGIVLIILGAIALAFQEIRYSTRKDTVDLGPIEVTEKHEKTIPLPPILGGAAVIGGIVLVMAAKTKRSPR